MWTTEMVTMLRYMINDLGEPPIYSDERLEKLIAASAKLAIGEIQFSVTYTVDISTPNITPDPTEPETLDEEFETIVLLKAVCLLMGSQIKSGGLSFGGYSLIDGPWKIDTRGSEKEFSAEKKTACDDYAQARYDYIYGNFFGKAILSAFRMRAGGYPTNDCGRIQGGTYG